MEPNNRYKYFSNDEKGNEQHLHTLDLAPLVGTSTVLSVVAKPLTWWASGMAVGELGWLNSKKASESERLDNALPMLMKIKEMGVDEYIKLLDKAYAAHNKKLNKAAKDGKDLHAELERFVTNRMLAEKGSAVDTTEYDEQIQPFIEWSNANVKKFLASEAHCYSEKYWVGGIMDAVAILNDGSYVIIDFKSSKEAYDTQVWQIGGYHIQIAENGLFDRDGNKIFDLGDNEISQHIVVPFGAEVVEPAISKTVDLNQRAFLAALELYKIKEGITN